MIKSMLIYGILIEDPDAVRKALETKAFPNLEIHPVGLQKEDATQYVLSWDSKLVIGEFDNDVDYISRGIDFSTLLSTQELLTASDTIRQLFNYMDMRSVLLQPEWMLILTDNDE